ncbi:MAG: hypothetical protein EKK64_06935 [Neisseriaceae bacterium]|nr:MAG: hypothetical protein EKK64_06935 [Neisseriaceae bacterium]
MQIRQSNTYCIEAMVDFSFEETKFLFDSKWNHAKAEKLREWVEIIHGPTRHSNLTATMKLRSVKKTKEECEEAFSNALKYINDTIESYKISKK